MLILNQGMQSKLSNSWTNEYKPEYLAMADDGSCATPAAASITGASSNNSSSAINTGSIVNSLLLRKTGANFSDNGLLNGSGGGGGGGGGNGGARGLEQKIQELKAEKEASETKKCPGSLNDQDSPLDFSVKRRFSFSGSFTDDSQGSSSSPANTLDYNEMSPPETDLNGYPMSNNNGSVNCENGRRTQQPEDGFGEDQKLIGQPKVGIPPVSSMPPLLNGMGVFPGLPSSLLGNASAINAFSQMVAATSPFMDCRNKKNNRPFKAYPKEALQMPLGFFGLPGLTNAIQHGADSGVFAGMSSEELMNLYNQQLQMFREKQQQTSPSTGLPGKVSSPPSSQISTTTPTTLHNNQHINGQLPLPAGPPPHQSISSSSSSSSHHPKSSLNSPHMPNNSSPISHLPHGNPNSNMSPPHGSPRHISPDHLAMNGLSTNTNTNNNSCPSNSPFPPPPPLPSSSINGTTLVSSTSSSFSHPNSRKRPRSLPDDQKDDAYWERRRKNNDAAKRSRDARRAKEDEIALRAALLEQENLKLRVEVAALKTETARLRCMLYNG